MLLLFLIFSLEGKPAMLKRLLLASALILTPALAAEARPTPEALAEALAAAIYPEGAPAEIRARILADVRNEFRETDEAIRRGEPDYLAEAHSAALLARQAVHPATRAAFADLARQIWAHAVFDASTNPILAIWNEKDPFVHVSGLGWGLARSDLEAAQRLRDRLAELRPDLVAPGDGAAKLLQGWAENEGQPLNQHFLVRMNAWVAGVEAAWPQMSAAQKLEAASVLHEDAVPSAETNAAVLGGEDLLGWLTAQRLAMTSVEREAHPELMEMLRAGAWAGGAATAVVPWGGGSAALFMQGEAMRIDLETQQRMMRYNTHMFGGGDPGMGAFGAFMGP